MKQFSLSRSLLVLSIFSFLFFSLGTNELMLYSLDEAKNAECAREMYERKDWIIPTFNNELRTDKPPLHYWVMMCSYGLLGVNEFSARLGSILCGVGTILLVFAFAWNHINIRTAWGSVIVLLASLHVGVQFRMAVPDPYLVFLLTLAWVSFYKWYNQSALFTTKVLWLFYAALGLAVLAKGPIALILVGLTILVFLFMRKEIRLIGRMNVFLGIAIILAIALPWYLAINTATQGAWTQGFLLKHNIGRYLEPMEGHGGIFLLTPLYVMVGLLPFSIFIPQGLKMVWKNREQEPALLFSFTIALFIVLFFSFSGTKLPNYTVPSYPFFAVLIGWGLDKILSDKASWHVLRPSLITYGIIAAILPLAFFFGLKFDPAVSHLAGWAVIFLTFPIGAIAAWRRYKHAQLKRMFWALSISFIITAILFFQMAYPIVDRENPVSQTLSYVKPEQKIFAYKQFNPAYVFYLDSSVEVYQTLEELKQALRTERDAIVLSRAEYIPELESVEQLQEIARKRDLFETPITVILKKSASL
ncbi:MAG: glycosyltransferase family 39 protein [Siphonobacter sp.]